MASTRRLQPSPLPAPELARLKEELPADYGSHLWDPEGQRVLVVRVPHDEPDLVNDLERAVQRLAPADVTGTPNLLLVGHHKAHLLPTTLLQDLMTARQHEDRVQCAALRKGVPAGQHRLYRAPDDPHRLQRLAIRVDAPTVADLQDEQLDAILAEIGPHARTPAYTEVRIVYLVADKDDIRIDGQLFMDDLHARWVEQEERRRLAAAVAAKEAALNAEKETQRQTALAEARRRELTATAPLRRRETSPLSWDADGSTGAADTAGRPSLPRALPSFARPQEAPITPPYAPRSASGPPGLDDEAARAEMYARLDAMPGSGGPLPPAGALWSRTATRAPLSVPERPVRVGAADVAATAPSPHVASPAPAQVAPAPAAAPASPTIPAGPPPALVALQARLAELKFDVLVKPPVPGIDLAAERATGYPQRVIAFAPDRLDDGVATRVLGVARDLDADMALVVCAQADADAKRRFIATKARHVDPNEIATLEL